MWEPKSTALEDGIPNGFCCRLNTLLCRCSFIWSCRNLFLFSLFSELCRLAIWAAHVGGVGFFGSHSAQPLDNHLPASLCGLLDLCPPVFYKNLSQITLGPRPMTSFYPSHLFKDSICKTVKLCNPRSRTFKIQIGRRMASNSACALRKGSVNLKTESEEKKCTNETEQE